MEDKKLSDSPTAFNIESVVSDLLSTLLRKHADYGGSVFQQPVLAPNTTIEEAILVRMSDKVNRIHNLLQNTAKVDESIEDSVLDLAGYCVLFLANRKLK